MQSQSYPEATVPDQPSLYGPPAVSPVPAPGAVPPAPHENELRGMLGDLAAAASAFTSQISVMRTRAEAYFASRAAAEVVGLAHEAEHAAGAPGAAL